MRYLLVILVTGTLGCAGEMRAPMGSRASEAPLDTPSPVPTPSPDAPTFKPEAARWESAASGSRAWTEFTYTQLEVAGESLLATVPGDIAQFCPRYLSLPPHHKKDFWVYLISSIAQFESSFNPALSYTENFTDSSGQLVVSRGLLQLSIESARAYGCELAQAQDLHDPYKNLLCGIKILNRWIQTDGVIRGQSASGAWRGGARYWSVLRRDTQYNSIRSWTAEQSYCR